MRSVPALLAALLLAACGGDPVTRGASHATGPGEIVASERQAAPPDSVVQFLLSSAAADFHAHNPSDPGRFREVHVGHVPTASGAVQYRLCGRFLTVPAGGEATWVPFATIRTSGYEQWVGPDANRFCDDPSFVRDAGGDLSASLQSNLESLR